MNHDFVGGINDDHPRMINPLSRPDTLLFLFGSYKTIHQINTRGNQNTETLHLFHGIDKREIKRYYVVRQHKFVKVMCVNA